MHQVCPSCIVKYQWRYAKQVVTIDLATDLGPVAVSSIGIQID